jgi:SAM-dependent methyltransferase
MLGKPKCDVCGSSRYAIFEGERYELNGKRFDLVKCKRCGMIYINPMPRPREIKEMYEGKYFESAYHCDVSEKSYFDNEEEIRKRSRYFLEKIAKYKKKGHLLEIGCAGGYFIAEAQKMGFQSEGLDISKTAVAFARKKLGLKVFNGRLADAPFGKESFDIVYMAHILEHDVSPSRLLDETRAVLRTGGLIVVEVPCFLSSFYYRFIRLFSRITRTEKRMRVFKVKAKDDVRLPYHLYEFSPKTLRRLIRSRGFHIVEVEQEMPIPESVLKGKGKIPFIRYSSNFMKSLVKNGLRGGSITVFAIKQ